MTDNTQTVVWKADYDPFGKATIDPSSIITNNLRFPGQYFDEEAGLHYNYFRTYDPSIGRYITSDPIGLDGGMNTYLYVGANPIIGYDPFGLIDKKAKKEAYEAAGRWGAYKAYSADSDATSAAKTSGLPGPWRGPQDAYRHCVWSCLMTRSIGKDNARAIGDIYEAYNWRTDKKNTKEDEQMDQANNAAGRVCGELEPELSCEEACMDRYKRCALTGYGGTPICY